MVTVEAGQLAVAVATRVVTDIMKEV